MRIYLLLAMAAGVSFIGSNCGGSGVGDPCVPEDEYLTSFSGFSVNEVNVESRSFQCQTRVCLVNHFQGRVSCPYGQVEDPDLPGSGIPTCVSPVPTSGTDTDCSKDEVICKRETADCQPGGSAHASSCRVPDRDGSRLTDRIKAAVEPQLVERRAENAVYCSCRCDGPDPNARYCECPSGFVCEELVEDLGLGKGQLAGSYCVKEGTSYDGSVTPNTCTSSGGNCDSTYERVGADNTLVEVGINPGASCLPSGAVCTSDDTCCVVPATDQAAQAIANGEAGQTPAPEEAACPPASVQVNTQDEEGNAIQTTVSVCP